MRWNRRKVSAMEEESKWRNRSRGILVLRIQQ